MKRLGFSALFSTIVAAAAAVGVVFLPVVVGAQRAAWLGIGLATASGALALLLKHRAMKDDGLASLTTGLKALGQVMVVRTVVLAAGLVWVARRGDHAMFFVGGFFVVYFAQQWMEIRYLLGASRRAELPKVEAR